MRREISNRLEASHANCYTGRNCKNLWNCAQMRTAIKKGSSSMERVAIIDMGSNSIRFIVMQVADNKSYHLEYQQKEAIRLGRGMSETGKLNPEGVERALACLHVYKHMMEVMQVTKCIAVATAAPTTPKLKAATKSASRSIFVQPAMTVTKSPSFGFSAVEKRHWNSYCKTKNGSAERMIRPYRMQSSSNCPSAFKRIAIGRRKIIPKMASTSPAKAETQTFIEKISRACFSFFSPSVIATSAAPPVPNIKPTQPRIISTGMMKLTAAKGVLPAKLDTKKPSKTP